MRSGLFAIAALALTACGERAAHPYPDQAQAQFARSCPPASAVCSCTWDAITRTVPYREYGAALARFRQQVLMDPRITRARTRCIEKHGSEG